MDEALALLDQWAALTTQRSMFSSDEVLNLVLDVRLALSPVVPDTIEGVVDAAEEASELVPA